MNTSEFKKREYVRIFIESKGCKLISESYYNKRSKIEIQCRCGNIFKESFAYFKRNTHQCKKCMQKMLTDKQRHDIEFVREYIASFGCKLISETYNRAKDKIKIQCHCGRIYEQQFGVFKTRKIKQCQICSKKIVSSYELEIREILDKYKINYICNNRDIIKPYELDFYLPEHRIAIEFNGDYWHMNPKLYNEDDINTTNGLKAKDIWKKDQIKKDLCFENNIKLITIWENDYNKEYLESLFID